MELQQVLNHTMKKSGLAESTELDIYGLILRRLGVDSNLRFDPNSNYEQLLQEAASSPCGIISANIKELNHILIELMRLYRKIDVRVQIVAYHYKVVITCFG